MRLPHEETRAAYLRETGRPPDKPSSTLAAAIPEFTDWRKEAHARAMRARSRLEKRGGALLLPRKGSLTDHQIDWVAAELLRRRKAGIFHAVWCDGGVFSVRKTASSAIVRLSRTELNLIVAECD